MTPPIINKQAEESMKMGVLYRETWTFGNNWGIDALLNTNTKTKPRHESLLTGRFLVILRRFIIKTAGGGDRGNVLGESPVCIRAETASVTI